MAQCPSQFGDNQHAFNHEQPMEKHLTVEMEAVTERGRGLQLDDGATQNGRR